MPDDLRLRQSPAPLQRLRRSTLLVAALVVVALVGLLAWGKTQVPPVSSWMAREQTPVPAPVTMPESLKAVERPYQELLPKPQPPIATPLPKPPPPPPPVVVPLPPPVQAQADPLPDFLDMMRKQQALSEKVAMQQQPPVTPPVVPQEPKKPARQAWRIKPTDIGLARKEGEGKGEASKAEREAAGKKGEAEKLIQHATWAKPLQVWRTLYMDQKLAGTTLDAVNSDEPGLTRIELSIPVFDVAGYGVEILPKGAIAVVEQQGKPNFGASTLDVKLLQIRFPGKGGEVVKFQGDVGDANGANGLRGSTNNHYGKLLAATAINALISLGGNSLSGTPNSFYQNPLQQTTREVAGSVSRDTGRVVEQQLKVPPTISAPAGTVITIQLRQNVTFQKPPLVVR